MRNELITELGGVSYRAARIFLRVTGILAMLLSLLSLLDFAVATGANLETTVMTAMMIVFAPLVLVCAEHIRA